MEHELWIQTHVGRQTETIGIVFGVVAKLLAQADQHAIEPAVNIGCVFCL